MTNQPDDLHYEDFDDVQRPSDDELAPIDLDALDDEIEPVEQDEAAGNILEVISALDDEIELAEQDKPAADIFETIAELDDEIEDKIEEKVEIQIETEIADKVEENVEDQIETEIIDKVEEIVTPLESIQESAPAAVVEAAAPVEPTLEVVEPIAEASEPVPEVVEKAPPKKRKRAAKAKVEETPPVEEVTVKAEKTLDASADVVISEAAAPSEVIYRVMIPLPDELAGTVRDLRKSGEITEMPPPGIELAAAFHAADLAPVQEALSSWARNHLPLQLEITAVLAEVIGARQYVAAWMLQPEEELHDAQRDLMRALEALINPLPDAPAAFHVRVTIGDHVSPKPFPHLIGQMQRDFEPFVWDAETVSLIQRTPESVTPNWEPVESFR